jgi:hypothetical protein
VAQARVQALQQLGQALPQATQDELYDLHAELQTLPADAVPDPVAAAVELAQTLPDATAETLKQHLQEASGRPLTRLEARLEAWATELERWRDAREGELRLLELVTRDLPNSPQLAAMNTQLRAALEQLDAMSDQFRAVRTQLAALNNAATDPLVSPVDERSVA